MSTTNMPPEYPTSDDFAPETIYTHVASWDFHRDPGSGGQNYGINLGLPEEGVCLVDYDINVVSDHNTKGTPVFNLVKKDVGPMNIPIGVQVGHRLTPGGHGGAGASFKGEIHMKFVSQADWMIVFLKKLGV